MNPLRLTVAFTTRSNIVRCLLLLAAVLVSVATYWSGLSGPFIFDDFPNLVNNQWLSLRGNTLVDWRSAMFSSESSILRRPVAMFTFTMQQAVFGQLDALPSKAINLSFHAACIVMVFIVCREISRAPLLRLSERQADLFPLITAAVWGFNPLHVSTVLYPVQRMAILATFFSFVALYVFLRFRNAWVGSKPTVDQLIACALWFGMALFIAIYAKENAVLVIWLVTVIEVTFYRGFLGCYRPVQMLGVSWLVFLIPTILILVLALSNLDWIRAGYVVRPFDLTERVLTEFRILWSYASWFAFPQLGALGMFHDDIVLSSHWTRPITTVLAAVGWLGVLAVSSVYLTKLPELMFGALFFLIGHSIESSVLALELVFEHRNYFPTFGLALLISVLSCRMLDWLDRHGVSRYLAYMPLVTFVFALAFSTAVRAGTWSSEIKLSQTSVAHHADSARSGLLYGNTLLKMGMASESPEESSRFMALAKHEFEVVARYQDEKLAALAMLYVIDEQFYPESGTGRLWLDSIELSLQEGVFSATDFVAMRTLVDCYTQKSCGVSQHRLLKFLDVFGKKFWRKSSIADLRYRILQAGESDETEILALVTSGLRDSPGDIELHYRRMEVLLTLGRFGAAHRQAIALMRADSRRRQLPAIRDIFSYKQR